ncbi:hypothetical protein [Plebeiibacterium sediminum]|uniref:Uncharacterized protein n=1 Tax=Plebeiibacterium sediminum TaxID=2992112 RepID=A0AAE3SE08_9BACT|nr:hypothetical protein [Plebeiobacterium sediminum]MCW3785850.1 hypothetical protein [Plebeiobacterium sediminum]
MRLLVIILTIILFPCQPEYNIDTLIESKSYKILFTKSDAEFCFENITIKDLFDSIFQKCNEAEYTGDYNIILTKNQISNSKFKLNIKGFVCPHSYKDRFYNPLNIYYLNDSLFIESNLNSHNPLLKSADFGENIGIDTLTHESLKSIDINSLRNILQKHLEICFSEYTNPPLIQLIAQETININELNGIFLLVIEEYYNKYTELSKRVYNKHLEDLTVAELDRIKKIINDVELNCNIRINSIQRIKENVFTIPKENPNSR